MLAEFASDEKLHEIKLDFSFTCRTDIKSNNTYLRGVFASVLVPVPASLDRSVGMCVSSIIADLSFLPVFRLFKQTTKLLYHWSYRVLITVVFGHNMHSKKSIPTVGKV